MDPLFWLGLSILFVAVSLTAVLVAALPALQELARAARSAEKLFDTLRRELPPTLEAIRLTGMEISDLTDDVSEGVQSAGQVVKQVDQSIGGARKQAKQVQVTTRSVFAGLQAGWKTFSNPGGASKSRRSPDRLPPTARTPIQMRDRYDRASLAQPPEEDASEYTAFLEADSEAYESSKLPGQRSQPSSQSIDPYTAPELPEDSE